MFVSQQRYVLELLEKFQMREARPISSPMDPNEKLSSNDNSDLADAVRYRQLVGSLIWLLNTRLDVSFVVGILSSFMQQPRKSHLRLAQRVLRYLRDTPTLGLWYAAGGPDSSFTLRGWCDSDWGGNPDSRRLTTGYVFTFGSGAVSWISKKQPTVALSSTEAEYRAACSATTEVIWIQRLLAELGFPQQKTVLATDNQSCIAIARNPVFHARTKHIEIQYHFVREKVLDGTVELQYCPTASNPADLLTKPLPQMPLTTHSSSLGLFPDPGAERGC